MNSLGIFFIKPKVKRGWNVDYYFYPYDEEINVVVKVECEYIFRWKKIYIFFIFSSHQNHSPSYNFVSGIDPIWVTRVILVFRGQTFPRIRAANFRLFSCTPLHFFCSFSLLYYPLCCPPVHSLSFTFSFHHNCRFKGYIILNARADLRGIIEGRHI